MHLGKNYCIHCLPLASVIKMELKITVGSVWFLNTCLYYECAVLSKDLCSTKSCPSNVLFFIVQENLHPAGFFLKVKILLKSGASDEDINSGITTLPRFHSEFILIHIQGDWLCHTQKKNPLVLAESAWAKCPFGFEVWGIVLSVHRGGIQMLISIALLQIGKGGDSEGC